MKRILWGGFTALLLLAVSLLLAWWNRSAEPVVPEGDRSPMGWWVLDSRRLVPRAEAEGSALSLPYARSAGAAKQQSGVLYRAEDAMAPGSNLVTSGHAAEVLLLDAAGDVLHGWRMPFERVFPEQPRHIEVGSFRRVRLLPDRSIVAIYQGGGMVRLDARSEVVWALPGGFYNDLRILPDGRLLSLSKEISQREIPGRSAPFLEDSVVEVDLDRGVILRRWSVLGALLESPWVDRLRSAPPNKADLLHSNTVQWVPSSGEGPGRLLVSLRELDALALLDADSGRLLEWIEGSWDAQHEPVPLANGEWLLFDNRGGPGGASRVLRFDPVGGAILREVPPADAGWELRSSQAGSVQPLDNGNLLITESYGGQAYEVTPENEIVWHYVSPYRFGALNEYQAVLFEVLRVAGS